VFVEIIFGGHLIVEQVFHRMMLRGRYVTAMTRKRQPTEFEKRMGTRLRELRQGADLSQAKLATAAGVSQRTVQNWEYGKRTFDIESAVKLADVLGITLDELVGRTPPKGKKGGK
jgi:DNA-binding XRE family transcriptional regulator